jgi:serine/threonine protein kinase
MEDLLGKKIENYQIDSVLGRGGMGIVYRAIDEKLDRYVAIKVLAVKAVDKQRFIERFKREAKNHAQLSHSNIVTVYGFIEYEGLLGIVMEYVEGESLERVLFKNTRLHIYDVVYIMRQVLEGIGYAHAKGFVHRDIKPSNIILNSEGTVKIMDFGISKSLVDKSMTSTGSKVGTVYYMSPEQIKGDDVNHLTDIYAIGCTIYEMIYGKPPFFAESEYDIMDGHLKKDHVKLTDLMPEVPAPINEIVDTCLRKSPAERYQYCENIIQKLHELDDYMKDVKSNYFIKTKKDPKRTKRFSIIATSVLVLVMASLFYFVYVQVGELLDSEIVDKFKEYSIDGVLESNSSDRPIFNVSQLVKGTDNSINSISTISDNYFIAVGDSGVFLKYSGDEQRWDTVKTYENVSMNYIHTFKDGRAFAVGNNSLILKSPNFFDSFERLSLSKSYNLRSIYFVNDFDGFIVGSNGFIIKTTDSGETWMNIQSNTDETLFDVEFLTEAIGFAIGWNGTIIKTEDGGKNWIQINSPTDKYLRAVDFWDEDLGIICGGAGTILRTENGGDSWKQIESGGLVGYNDVKFLSEKIALIVGAKGSVIISSNSGKTWQKMDVSTYANLNKIEVPSEEVIYLAGINGTILKLENRN